MNFRALARLGMISESDLTLFRMADDPEKAFEILREDLTRRFLLPERPLPEAEETPAIAKSRHPDDTGSVQK